MGELMGLFILVPAILAVFWVIFSAGQAVQSVNRTGKAIGKWNDEKLGKK